MTDTVKCRVCGLASPLGTAECPDCGAPLPQELPKTPEPTVAPVEEAAPVSEKKEPSPKRRRARWVAGFLAVCLSAELAAVLWPQKPTPPGVAMVTEGLATPEGVWDYTADGFVCTTSTADGRYFILQQVGEDAASKTNWVWEALSSSSVSMSYAYYPDGDYYLFDGRTLEKTDWATATLLDSGVVFYTVQDDMGTTLSRRELSTGKVTEIDRTEGEVELTDLLYSADGTALAFRWEADGETPYSLWRVGDKEPVELDEEGNLLNVASGSHTCLFWQGETFYVYGDPSGGRKRGDGDGENRGYYLWRDGEILNLPDRMPIQANRDLTEFLQLDYLGNWYYWEVDAGTEGVKLDVPAEGYLSSAGLYNEYQWDALTGHFYLSYSNEGNEVYYLTHRGELCPVTEGLDGDFLVAEDGQSTVYQKGGELWRAAVLPDETVETSPLTQTGGMVDAFAANGDLTHLYYVAQSPEGYRGGKTLYHWHDDESHPLDFEYGLTYNAYQNAIEVTPDGGCYFKSGGDVYYTQGDAPPTLVLEDAGMGAQPQLVGPSQWPLVTGAVWEGGANKQVCWRLDGAKEPVELTAWTPKEGTVK